MGEGKKVPAPTGAFFILRASIFQRRASFHFDKLLLQRTEQYLFSIHFLERDPYLLISFVKKLIVKTCAKKGEMNKKFK